MGYVTNVRWTCPGCNNENVAQAYGAHNDPEQFPRTAVPADRGLKWNPPCIQCGAFRLVMPEVFVECVPQWIPHDQRGRMD